MGSRRTRCVRACVVAVVLASAPLAARQTAAPDAPDLSRIPGLDQLVVSAAIRQDKYAPADRSPVALSVVVKRGAELQAERLFAAAKTAMARFDDWLGPFPFSQLTIVDAPWSSDLVGASAPGVIVVNSRWITPVRDRALERQVISAIARQYWFGARAPRPPADWFDEALVLYSGGRAIDSLLELTHFHTDRYFGGFLAYSVRSVSLSPPPVDARPRLRRFAELDQPSAAAWRFATTEDDSPAQRGATALHTVERYIGWPALQQALIELRGRFPDRPSASTFSSIASEQRGRSLSWLIDEAFGKPSTFDYAVEQLESAPSATDPDRFETRVAIRRVGDAVFAGTSEPSSPGTARSLEVEVQFADGSAVRDWWDGRQAEGDLVYLSDAPAVAATIDPELVLVLDDDRANNTKRLSSPWSRTGARLALNWVIWLQNMMLTYSGLA